MHKPLTQTEEEILRLIASLLSNQSVAARMRLQPDEVAALRSSAMQKTGLTTRLQVIHYARERGWLTD